jgi:sulfide:quinone oxidoreductase
MESGRPLNVLIAGGGVAALETALALGELAPGLVAPVLIAPSDTFVYRPALVAEAFGSGVVHRFDLAELAVACGAVHLRDAVVAVDADQRMAVTADGVTLPYEALVLAMGAQAEEAVPGAASLGLDGAAVREIAADLRASRIRRILVAVPAGTTWALPAYEAALFLADLARRHHAPVEITLVTPEEAPLALFGRAVAEEVARLLAEQEVELVTAVSPIAFVNDQLTVSPAGRIGADGVVALPRLRGPGVAGVPTDATGFIRTDAFGRVDELADVYAAGDATAFPVKQGGLATQQADVVARMIASEAGAPITPRPFEPVLRGLLLGAGEPRFLRSELGGGHGDTSAVSSQAMWWPPSKIAGRYLAPFLADRLAEEADRPTNVG